MGTGDRNPKRERTGKIYKGRKNFTMTAGLNRGKGKKESDRLWSYGSAEFDENFGLKRWKVTGRVFPSVILVERAEWAFPDSRPD